MAYDIRAIRREQRQRTLAEKIVARSTPSELSCDAPQSLVGLTEWNRIIDEVRKSIADGTRQGLPSVGSSIVEIIHKVPQLRNHVFVGFNAELGIPQLVPKKVLYDHCYILGATGSGKTQCGMVPLVEQLGAAFDGDGKPLGELPSHPLIIFDMKEIPDIGLKAAADRVAQSRGQGEHCLFYSPDEDFESPRWDILSSARKLRGVNKQVGFLLNGFGLVYDPVYGEEYFTNAMGTALTAVIHTNGIHTLSYNRLVDLVGEVVTAKKKRISNKFKDDEVIVTSWRDARGLYDKIQRLRLLDKLATDSSVAPADTLNLQQVIEQGQVLYVHLGSTFMPNESWDIGRMMVFSLLAELIEQIRAGTGEIGKRRRCFLFVDEFQRLGVKNIVQRFEDARSLGLSFILSHQTPKSLPKKDGGLFEIVFQNCAFRQAFSIEDLDLLEMFEQLSGFKSAFLRSDSTTVGSNASRSQANSASQSEDVTETYRADTIDSISRKQGTQTGHAETNTQAQTHSNAFGLHEQRVPRFDYEANRLANACFPSSVIYVRDGGRGSLTPTEAIPRHIHGMFIGPQESRTLSELGFVLRSYENEPQSVTPLERRGDSTPAAKLKKQAAKAKKKKRGEAMKRQIAEAAKKLAPEMPVDRTLLYFARLHGIDSVALVAKCKELKIELATGNDSIFTVEEMEVLAQHFGDNDASQ